MIEDSKYINNTKVTTWLVPRILKNKCMTGGNLTRGLWERERHWPSPAGSKAAVLTVRSQATASASRTLTGQARDRLPHGSPTSENWGWAQQWVFTGDSGAPADSGACCSLRTTALIFFSMVWDVLRILYEADHYISLIYWSRDIIPVQGDVVTDTATVNMSCCAGNHSRGQQP